MRKRKFILINLALFGVSLVAALGAAEMIVRVAMPRDDIAGWFQSHAKYHHTVKANFHQAFRYRAHGEVMDVQTNAAGFRDAAQTAPPEDATTVLFLGDSFVFGYGVDVKDRLDTRLRTLAAEAGRAIHTVNWGVPGWGTALQARYVCDHIAQERPDVLVLVFCHNDPANDRGVGLPVLPDTDSALYPLKAFLRRHSHLYRLLLEVRTKARAQDGAPAEDAAPVANGYAISGDDWKRTENGIRTMYSALFEANPDARMLILAATPDRTGVDGHLAAIAGGGRHVHYVDLSPYIAHLPDEARVMPWDGHWSPAVHTAAARAILDAIVQF